MSDLFWPGDERAGDLMSQAAFLRALVRVEEAWLAALVEAGIAPVAARHDLSGLVEEGDAATVATRAEAGGNPVIPLLDLLRERLATRRPDAARWLHRGLTSQDVLDTGLMLCVADALGFVADGLRSQIGTLARLADTHRGTLMVGRTLTQHAVPITFGTKVAAWLHAVVDAAEDVSGARGGLAGQFGGAAGTMAAAVELARLAGLGEPVKVAGDVVGSACRALGLPPAPPWHTSRARVTRVADALVRCTDAWGRIAGDVLTLSRPEIGELAEPAGPGRGGSSTMPQKANPVLSLLIRRAAIVAATQCAQLHLAAADARDERPEGAWHAEWAALRDLARRTAVAGSQASQLLGGLRVHRDRMAATLASTGSAVLAEQHDIAALFGRRGGDDPAAYLGAADRIVDAALERAAHLA
jgi:3-carboxy-cis,cis-muconate cycloisomerase